MISYSTLCDIPRNNLTLHVPKLEKSVISKISKNAITTSSEILHKTETIEHTNNKDIDIVKNLVLYR